MIVVPQPMPDEIARSILGRMMRLNGLGCRSSVEAVKTLRGITGVDTSKVGSTVGFIAHVLERDPRDFVAQHTLFPWWIIVRKGNWLDGDGRLREGSLAQTIQPQRPYVSLCPDCVSEDLQFHGFSYWRRGHQLDGVYECLKHGVGLRHYSSVDIVRTFPSEALGREPLSVSSGLRNAERGLQRLITDLGEGQVSISASIVCARLKRLLATDGKGSVGREVQLEIQAKLEDLFSEEWMRENVPGFCRSASEPLSREMTRFFSRARLSSISYVLAFAIAILNREEDVFKLLATPPTDTEVRKSQLRRTGTGRQELVRSYIRYRGRYGRFLPENGSEREVCRARLAAMGLPDLDGQMLEAVRLFFTEDLSISETIRKSGVDLVRFEALFRTAGASLRHVYEQMPDVKGQSRRPSSPRLFRGNSASSQAMQ